MKGFYIWVCLFVFVATSEATKIRKIPSEELVVQSDFVGVVECTRAGGVVAVYRVIDPWKGSFEVGAELRVKVYPDTWGPEFPAAYVGQQYLIAGDHRDSITPASMGMPLWVRQHDVDVVLPLFQGRSLLGSGRPLLNSEFTKIEAFKRQAMEWIGASAEEQESSTPKLEDPPTTETAPPPSADEIKVWREGFAKGDERENWHRFLKGLYGLSEHEPERVLSWLISWKNPYKDAFDAGKGYRYGSVFCMHCGQDRAKSFRKLLKAEDAYVRVAAAIYLTFENEAEGIEALKQLESTLYYSEAGLWAALTLARRGDKTRMPRLLKHLAARNPNSASVKGSFHGLMQTRTKVLLSNSCAASEVELPDRILQGREKDHVILAWWAAHEAEMTLADPWLPRFSAQRVD